jgi:excisionase family DNA binding protein
MDRKNSHRRFQSHQSPSQHAPEQSLDQDEGNAANGNGDHSRLFVSAAHLMLTAEEVAQILRVPRSWIYSHLDQLPTVRLGRYVRFRRSEIELFLDQQKAC